MMLKMFIINNVLIVKMCIINIIIMQELAFAIHNDIATDQISIFKQRNKGPIGILTTSNGDPVEFDDADDTLIYSSLIDNEYFMDTITHLDRERIPERVVHAKGGGAQGYFEVTHNITEICKAELFSSVGKITPISVRFSLIATNVGGSDLQNDVRGFAVKFYTKEGNFDIPGLNTPIFLLKDPLIFPNFIHARKRNPATNLMDYNMLWDFITLHPETLFQFLYTFSGRGIPHTYRHMPGFGIHTYQVENSLGETYFVRFHFVPDLGVKDLPAEEAREIGADDPDYFNRDLYNAIAQGNYSSWTLYIQALSMDDLLNADFDVFDITRLLPEDKYPLRPVGRIVLNKNPINYFNEIEELAFCPGNLVPGIIGAPDKVFQARRLSYRDTQYHRLGANFHRLPINCPFRSKTFTYLRDGNPTFHNNGLDAPNYYPNSFFGPVPRSRDKNRNRLLEIKESKPYNFDQLAQFLSSMTSKEKDTLVKGIMVTLGKAAKFLQKRAISYITFLNKEVGEKLAEKIVSR